MQPPSSPHGPSPDPGAFQGDEGQEPTESRARQQERAGGLGQQVAEKGRSAGERAKEGALSFIESGKQELASKLSQVATALRHTGEQLEQEEIHGISGVTADLGRRAERISDYIRSHEASELVAELEDLARRRQAVFVGGAFALGVLAARFLKGKLEEEHAVEEEDAVETEPSEEHAVETEPSEEHTAPGNQPTTWE